MNLLEIRHKIDTLDAEIVGLLSKRSSLVTQAGRLKKSEAEVRAADRVAEVIQKVRQEAAKAGMDPAITEKIYRTITDCFINKEMSEFMKAQSPSVRIYRREDLPLKPAVPGAKMWAVGLEKSMLTYFDMKENTSFPEHSHEAEQITMVLEGELTFTVEAGQIAIGPGEVIAIPSNVVHSVSTGNAPCKAVDAWSPVKKEYL
jgi:chorismate mutase/quercetin dioxygenase-like cupin family protein